MAPKGTDVGSLRNKRAFPKTRSSLTYSRDSAGARKTCVRRAIRARQGDRNCFALLLLSQGVPMILAGDECRRTQHGNNNPYLQDRAATDVERGSAADFSAYPDAS